MAQRQDLHRHVQPQRRNRGGLLHGQAARSGQHVHRPLVELDRARPLGPRSQHLGRDYSPLTTVQVLA